MSVTYNAGGRGFTGHEHLDMFGLINMNARLYDPLLGRFLAPDPYVQLPEYTQSYNRYSYCLNNPLCYVDENGELIFSFITGFWKGLFKHNFNPFKALGTAYHTARNQVKIVAGLFKGNFGQIVSRFTREILQTITGYGFAQISNLAGQVDRVGYWGGATVTSGNNWGKTAVTLGSYIIGNETIAPDPHNTLFQHEYGHYLQSQSMGFAYLFKVGIPSLASAASSNNHDFKKFEQDANARAFLYFNEHVPGFYQDEASYRVNIGVHGWNFWENPLNLNGLRDRSIYYDYRDENVREQIRKQLMY